MADSHRLLIVGGPNGSGKTTLALAYAEEQAIPYVGADAIAASLNPDHPAAARVTAAREFKSTVDELVRRKRSFVCESTLSGLTMRTLFATARDSGYTIGLVFLFVDSADVCVARVAERVRAGGHDVPEIDIRRRFDRSVRRFWNLYRELADSWLLLYNGSAVLQDVAVGRGSRVSIRNSERFLEFLELVGDSR